MASKTELKQEEALVKSLNKKEWKEIQKDSKEWIVARRLQDKIELRVEYEGEGEERKARWFVILK